MPQVTSCPGCRPHRQHVFPGARRAIQSYLRCVDAREWRRSIPASKSKARRHGLRRQRPGQGQHANLGISLPGTFEDPVAPVYIDGKLSTTLRGDTIVAEFKQILDHYVESHYGQVRQSRRTRRHSLATSEFRRKLGTLRQALRGFIAGCRIRVSPATAVTDTAVRSS